MLQMLELNLPNPSLCATVIPVKVFKNPRVALAPPSQGMKGQGRSLSRFLEVAATRSPWELQHWLPFQVSYLHERSSQTYPPTFRGPLVPSEGWAVFCRSIWDRDTATSLVSLLGDAPSCPRFQKGSNLDGVFPFSGLDLQPHRFKGASSAQSMLQSE